VGREINYKSQTAGIKLTPTDPNFREGSEFGPITRVNNYI